MTCLLLRRLRRGTRTSGARTCGGCVDVYILWLLGAVCIAHGVFGRAAAPWLSARCTLLRSCRQWASRSCYQRYGRVCMLYVLYLLGARLVATTGQHKPCAACRMGARNCSTASSSRRIVLVKSSVPSSSAVVQHVWATSPCCLRRSPPSWWATPLTRSRPTRG